MLFPSTFLPKFAKMEQHGIYSPLQVDAIKPLHLLCFQPKQETEDILDFFFLSWLSKNSVVKPYLYKLLEFSLYIF